MARSPLRFDQSLKALLGDAPVALAIDVILHRESDAAPAFDALTRDDDEDDDVWRKRITTRLGAFGREVL